MGAQQKRRRCAPMRGKSCNEIDESYLAPRRVIRECLPCYLPPDQPKLVLDVIPGFFDRFRPGRTRPEVNQALDMSQSFSPETSSQILGCDARCESGPRANPRKTETDETRADRCGRRCSRDRRSRWKLHTFRCESAPRVNARNTETDEARAKRSCRRCSRDR